MFSLKDNSLFCKESLDEFINEIINEIEKKSKVKEKIGDIIKSNSYLIYKRKFDTFGKKIKDGAHINYHKQNCLTSDGKKMILHTLLESKRCPGSELAYIPTQAVDILEFSTGFPKYFDELFDNSILKAKEDHGNAKYYLKLKIAKRRAKCHE